MAKVHADNTETATAVTTVNTKDTISSAGQTFNLRIIGTGNAAATIKNNGIKTLDVIRRIE